DVDFGNVGAGAVPDSRGLGCRWRGWTRACGGRRRRLLALTAEQHHPGCERGGGREHERNRPLAAAGHFLSQSGGFRSCLSLSSWSAAGLSEALSAGFSFSTGSAGGLLGGVSAAGLFAGTSVAAGSFAAGSPAGVPASAGAPPGGRVFRAGLRAIG